MKLTSELYILEEWGGLGRGTLLKKKSNKGKGEDGNNSAQLIETNKSGRKVGGKRGNEKIYDLERVVRTDLTSGSSRIMKVWHARAGRGINARKVVRARGEIR